MDNNSAPKKGSQVTKAKIKVMNFEKEFFPKMTSTNTRPSNKEIDRTNTADGAKKALKELLMA
ncbi:hypothetical protein KOI40_06160 [Aestuariicella sp. G3-2]|uniref:hypothetical protein n=1 Tax=Pseudomaricurvus albidus TaxID=2842452 RepID=UPI001C0A9634|nr:hypothetical protein [Aestuariicella albida]MBU3069398.1 hypothetical protein [Aestuariicella albida]